MGERPSDADAQKRCVKGIPCGNTCIAAGKTCRVGSSTSSPRPAAPSRAPEELSGTALRRIARSAIPSERARARIGDSVAVSGRVVAVRYTSAGDVHFELGRPCPDQHLLLVLRAGDMIDFGNLDRWNGLAVIVHGRILPGVPFATMVIRRPSQPIDARAL